MWDQHRATRRIAIASASAFALWRLVGQPADSLAAQSPGTLVDFLHFVEQVQIDRYEALLAAFDEQAFANAGLPPGTRARVGEVLNAEQVHIALLTRPRGVGAPTPPRPAPASLMDALRDAVTMENIATAAYAAVIPAINRRRLLPNLIGIQSVEARQAAWLSTLVGADPFPEVIDRPLSPQEVLARLGLPEPEAESSATPEATPAASSASGPPFLDAIARKLGVSPSDVRVLRLEQRDWPDTSLGCPQPDTMYAQVITPGYLVEVEAGGRKFEFHTDEQGNIVRCS
ncbi:MAG: ferritin-like domain-containing protein [Thermomicrobiales bacterium]|nr:ferritin-like domain-containing protein [Thermomicrobiales bacterium]